MQYQAALQKHLEYQERKALVPPLQLTDKNPEDMMAFVWKVQRREAQPGVEGGAAGAEGGELERRLEAAAAEAESNPTFFRPFSRNVYVNTRGIRSEGKVFKPRGRGRGK
jgi:hypothetical protein